MLFAHETPPAMWHGVRANSEVATASGFKFLLFSVPTQDVLDDVGAFLVALEPVESPFLVDGQLSEAALRGREVFNDEAVGCAVCHYGPFYTDLKLHDVRSRAPFDTSSYFDTPQLNEVWRTAPYLHDGRYVTMREVFTVGRHGDTMGDIEGLTEQQIDDLVEYVLSL
jgi:cytochrome c peroxidase